MTTAELRRFPYPFGAMIAISSDIDWTRLSGFRLTHRFMNTLEDTPIGPGVGLDIADSMWLYRRFAAAHNDNLHDQMTYFAGADWQRTSVAAEEIVAYAKAGWIDTLHTYGDFSTPAAQSGGFTRRHAEEGLAALVGHGVHLPVWVNHGNSNNTQNIGDIDYARGDDPASPSFHYDLLAGYGCRFMGLQHVGAFGSANPLEPLELREGKRIWGFERSAFREDVPDGAFLALQNGLPFFRKRKGARDVELLWVWLPTGVGLQFAEELLDEAVENGRFVIAAQHLGCCYPFTGFTADAIAGFRRLAAAQEQGRILVARTSRLLEYARVSRSLRYSARRDGESTIIAIESVDDPVRGAEIPTIEELRGVTFYVPAPQATRILVGGREVPGSLVRHNPPDAKGPSIGIAWHGPDWRDYTEEFRDRPDIMRVAVKAPDGAAAKAAEPFRPLADRLKLAGLAGSGRPFFALGSGGGGLPATLAALNAPKGKVFCFEPDVSRRLAAEQSADELGVRHRVEFHHDKPLEDAFAAQPAWVALVSETGQRFDHEAWLAGIETASRRVYVSYPGLGHHLTRLSRDLTAGRTDAARALASDLFGAELYGNGLGGRPGLRILDRAAFLRAARAHGWRAVWSPPIANSENLFPALDGEYDVFLEKLAADSKYPIALEDSTSELASILGLIERGCPRLALSRMETAGIAKAPETLAVRALARLKAGIAVDPDSLAPGDASVAATKARALALHAAGRFDEAEGCYRRLPDADPHVPFLRSALDIDFGRHRKAAAAFAANLRARSDAASLVGRLAALAEMSRFEEMSATLASFGRACGALAANAPLKDQRPGSPGPRGFRERIGEAVRRIGGSLEFRWR